MVIAEGAEDGMIPEERQLMREKLGLNEEVKKDESGNVKLVVSIQIIIKLTMSIQSNRPPFYNT